MENIKNVAPSYFTIEEGALSLIAESERSFTEMMKEIGISELHSFEESGVVHEAVNIKETIEKIANWFKKQWEQIKEFIDKCLVQISKKISEAKKNIVKFEKFKKAVDNLKDEKKVYATTYKYHALDDIIAGEGRLMDAATEYSMILMSDFTKRARIIKDDEYESGANTQKIKSDLSDIKHKFIKEMISIGVDGTTDTIKLKGIKDYIRGEEIKVDKKYIVNNSREIWSSATDYNDSVRQLKKSYNEARKEYDEAIKFIKGRKEEQYEYIGTYLPYIKNAKEIYRDILLTAVSCVTEKVRTNMMICLKVSLAIKSKEEKEADGSEGEVAKESAIQTTKFESELSTLFDF